MEPLLSICAVGMVAQQLGSTRMQSTELLRELLEHKILEGHVEHVTGGH